MARSSSRHWLVPLLAAAVLALVLSVAPAPPSASAAVCSNAKTYAGQVYCPAAVKDVRRLLLPNGSRVWLAVTVETVTPTTVQVGQWEWPTCPPGLYCGASATLQEVTVPWSGTARPAYGEVITLYGQVATSGTSKPLRPVGFDRLGFCPIDWC